MKHLKKLLLVAIFTVGLGGVANAQKTAHINTDKLLASMPETKAMQAELEKLKKTYNDDIESLVNKLKAKITKYEAEGKSQTQEENQKRAIEVQQDRQKIAQAEQQAAQELQKKYQERTLPILKKAEEAIKAVAAEKSIIYVFDAAPGKGLIVYDKGEDIYNAVKTKLGF
ncbi:OmpH family outer membrane protein [Tenacibaculum xiamenense]|uniref:OmpH family outer membrane protein n=1 Tax=Tenacibaculum xiamenense TaxID=1261553 RepID=UPI003894F161